MEEITTLDMFARRIEVLNKKRNISYLYRGCGKYSHQLLPSLYRHGSKKKFSEILNLEKQILERFKQRSIPYLDRPNNPENNWEHLFLMQHYGVPTRLLDWSENPYIALFFALTSAIYNYNSKKYSYDAAFWVLNATDWNIKAIDKSTYSGEILTQSNPLLNGFEPLLSEDRVNKYPVAIYGAYNSQRIVAQRGAFTIFGSSVMSMEKIMKNESFPPDALIKYRISKKNIPRLLNSLLSIGITDAVVFPDLEGLAREIKRLFKFEVGYV